MESVILPSQKNGGLASSLLEHPRMESEIVSDTNEEKLRYLQQQIDEMKGREEVKDSQLQSKIVELKSLEMQLVAARSLAADKESLYEASKVTIVTLKQQIAEAHPELDRTRDKIKELERNLNAQLLLKVEQDTVVSGLRRDLKATMDAKTESTKQLLSDLQDFKKRAAVQIAGMSDELAALQSSLEDKLSLIKRLQTEAQTNERNHALRTAMLATTEAQLKALQSELLVKEETAREAVARSDILQNRLLGTEERFSDRQKAVEEKLRLVEKALSDSERAHTREIEQLREEHEAVLANVRKDYSKKSSLARQLLSDREEEVNALTLKLGELQAEIKSGAPTERRIFELAELQAKREAIHGQHR